MNRKILHLDLDAFFCAVEEQRDPGLRGLPFAVGGRPEERGVVSSCSYPARQSGVHSALPMRRALQLCPGLRIVPPHHDLYGKVSRQVMERLRALTPLVEQISIDEAFMDVTALPEDGGDLARRVQGQIREELGLPCSLGVATNKLAAKIATDYGKRQKRKGEPPNAITVIPPGEEAAFLAPLPVNAIWGVGPKTATRLAELGIQTIGDLARWPEDDLAERFGKNGRDMAARARGIDESPIITARETKSISQETTFVKDVSNLEILKKTLRELSEGVSQQLVKEGLYCQTIRLKFRWPDFKTATRQVTLPEPLRSTEAIYEVALKLFERLWKPRTSVRLLGVGAGRLINEEQAKQAKISPGKQLELWDIGKKPDI
jgi:DNA polymerase IV